MSAYLALQSGYVYSAVPWVPERPSRVLVPGDILRDRVLASNQEDSRRDRASSKGYRKEERRDEDGRSCGFNGNGKKYLGGLSLGARASGNQ